MKLLSRLVIALVICLLAIPIMATPVQAGITGMTLHTNKGNVGEEVYITGDSTDDSHYYVYYQINTDEWEEVLDYGDIEFEGTELEGYSYTTEKFEIPESCGGQHNIVICNHNPTNPDDDDIDDYEEDSEYFTVEPKVEITKPTNAKGPLETEVAVKGTGFDEDEGEIDILFDSDVVSEEEFTADEYGTWEGTFLVPAASKGDHDVSAAGDYTDETDVTEASFEVTPGISIDPTSGKPGTTTTVSGSGFEEDEEDIYILFDGDVVKENITADEDGCWEGTFQVPEAAKGKYDVTAEGETTDKADIDKVEFEVVSGITLYPTEGHVGTSLTVSGSGLPAGESVTVTYDGVSKGSSTTGSDGSLSGISFEATHTQSTHTADHSVVATYDTTTVTQTFVMESTAPSKPTLTSPASGSRMGTFRKQTPTFDWSAVTDDSGVTYNLELGTTADFAQVLISRTGLTDTSYTLAQAEALDYGTYYWRVKAIDGALNDNGWTSAYSFKSGLLPLWAFVAIVALLVVLIGILVYFFARRRGSFYD